MQQNNRNEQSNLISSNSNKKKWYASVNEISLQYTK